MQTLRRLTHLARFVLVWFVLSLGVAVASPLVAPQDTVLVCTGAGAMKMLVKSADGSTTELGRSTMDCPLCALVAPPPVLVQAQVPPVSPLAYALQAVPSAHIAARTAAPLPARGPPIHS